MSDKSSDIEDWTFVDKDGELELSDEGSSASSIEVVNVVENDVVTYQNRRSLERSVSPNHQNTSTIHTENGKCSEEDVKAESFVSSTSLENQETIENEDSFASNSDADGRDNISKQKLSPMNSLAADQPQIQREMSVTSDISNVPSIQSIPSDVSDNSSDADSDYIRLESESLDGDNRVMTSSSVSSNFNFISRENSPSTGVGVGDDIAVAKISSEELAESSHSHSDKSISQVSFQSINQELCESFTQESDKGIHHEPDLNCNQEFKDDNQNPADYNDQLDDENQNLEDGNLLQEAHNMNPADRLENGIPNLVIDNQIHEADNQNPVEMEDGLVVDVQHQLVDNQVLEVDNQNPQDNLEREDLSDVEHHDQSAEVEEDQDRNTDSGTEDDRIESDQSDTGSIPPLDDDMSFVNDIGDLPLVAGDVARQYVHNPNRHLNLILDVIAILMFAVVLGLGIGHAIATFDEIEEYETLHSNIANLRSQAHTCQNEKWSQNLIINDLKVDQKNLNMKYEESKAEQEKLRIKNAFLIMELEKFRKLEPSTNGDNDIRLQLKNEINQLNIEKEELKQMIGQLKYTTHPANKKIDKTDDAKFNNELCDKSASDTKTVLKYEGKRLSDCSLDDLQEIHNSERLDNSLLKQEVGRLRYTSYPSNQVAAEMKPSKDKVNVNTEHQKITEDLKCENVTALKEELDHAHRYAEIWYQKYSDLKEQNQLNATNCLKYIISNFNTTQFHSSVNTTVLRTWLINSAAMAKDLKDVVSDISSKVWDDISKTSQEILQTITDEFQKADDLDYVTDDITDDDDIDLDKDVTDITNDVTDFVDDVTNFADDVLDLGYDETDVADEDDTDQDAGNKEPRNEADEEIDSDSSNDTDENTNHHAKWSDNVKDILNKTRHKMSNVSQQIKDTWRQVKNLSHQFWDQHEGKVTKTLTKITNKVVNIGNRLKDKLQRKVSKWYNKDQKKQNNKHTPKQQKNKEPSEGKIRRNKHHKYRKNNSHNTEEMRKCKKNQKHLKHQAKKEQKLRKQTEIKKKNKDSPEKFFVKTLSKFRYKMYNKMDNVVFKKLSEKARQIQLNKIYHIQRLADELGYYSDKNHHNSKVKNHFQFLHCEDLWWSSVIVKDMPTDSQILHCSQFLPDWQMKNLLKRRRILHVEGKLQMVDEMTTKKIAEIQKKLRLYDENEKVQQVKDGTHSDDTYVRSRGSRDDSADWQLQRAQDREEVRQRESGPDWLFERAKRRGESRDEESEPDWLFDRAKHRMDLRYKEWEEPEWTFKRAKSREEVREESHQPDWVFDRAHDREKLRDQSSRRSSSRRQRHVARMVDCSDY